MMKNVSISIYYNDEFGYIITSDTMVKGLPIHAVVNPVISKPFDINSIILGEAIKEGFLKSLNAKPVELSMAKTYNFWQITGTKSFSSFSKKFKMIEILVQENEFIICEWTRDKDGSYSEPQHKEGKIRLSNKISYEELADKVMEILHDFKATFDSEYSFSTIDGNIVTYKKASEEFISKGDGNTDAYQIYTYIDSPSSYIAFLIDNGYEEYNDSSIKMRWEKLYGSLSEFNYKKIDNDKIILQAYGSNKEKVVVTTVFEKENDIFEVLVEIDCTNTSLNTQEKIMKEYYSIVDSIHIKSF